MVIRRCSLKALVLVVLALASAGLSRGLSLPSLSGETVMPLLHSSLKLARRVLHLEKLNTSLRRQLQRRATASRDAEMKVGRLLAFQPTLLLLTYA